MITFAMKLRANRNLLGLSQIELAELSGVGQWSITAYEREKIPMEKHVVALQTALEKRAVDLRVPLPYQLIDPQVLEAAQI